LFVCDQKHLVLMYDNESMYSISLLQEEGEQSVQGDASGKSASAAKTIHRICSSAKPNQSSTLAANGNPSQSPADNEHLTSKTDNQIDGTISSSHSSGNSDSDTSSPASSKPKTGQSKLKVKTKRK